jgi:hypothetical protein
MQQPFELRMAICYQARQRKDFATIISCGCFPVRGGSSRCLWWIAMRLGCFDAEVGERRDVSVPLLQPARNRLGDWAGLRIRIAEGAASPSTSERLDRLPKEDALIPGLLAPTCLLPSQSRVHCEVLRHCYMSIKAEFAVPTPGSLILCKSHLHVVLAGRRADQRSVIPPLFYNRREMADYANANSALELRSRCGSACAGKILSRFETEASNRPKRGERLQAAH